MKYLCFAWEEESVLNGLSRDEWHALRDEVLRYVDALRESGKLIAAHPLQSAKTSTAVRVRNNAVSITDGPYVETKEQIGGYFLIEVASREEAISIAAGWPSARIGTIELRPVDDGLSMERRYTTGTTGAADAADAVRAADAR